MALECKPHNFKTQVSACLPEGGVAAVRAINAADIDLGMMNGALATYFDTATYQFKAVALPLVASKAWSTLEPDFADAVRTATSPTKRTYHDIAISSLRFQGATDTKKVQEFKKAGRLVTTTLLNNGRRIVDGIFFNESTGKLEITDQYTPMQLAETVDSSSTFDNDLGENLVVNLTGRQPHKGFDALFTWASMVP